MATRLIPYGITLTGRPGLAVTMSFIPPGPTLTATVESPSTTYTLVATVTDDNYVGLPVWAWVDPGGLQRYLPDTPILALLPVTLASTQNYDNAGQATALPVTVSTASFEAITVEPGVNFIQFLRALGAVYVGASAESPPGTVTFFAIANPGTARAVSIQTSTGRTLTYTLGT